MAEVALLGPRAKKKNPHAYAKDKRSLILKPNHNGFRITMINRGMNWIDRSNATSGLSGRRFSK